MADRLYEGILAGDYESIPESFDKIHEQSDRADKTLSKLLDVVEWNQFVKNLDEQNIMERKLQ